MIEEQGRITGVNNNRVWVQTSRQGTCQSCRMRSGCGQRLMSELTGVKTAQIEVENRLNARIGDQVVLGIGETALLKASVLVYLVPLVGMLVAALVADRIMLLGDGGTALFAFAGLLVALVIGRQFQSTAGKSGFQPKLLRVVATESGASIHVSQGGHDGHDELARLEP